MLLAQGVKLGNTTEEFLKARDLWCFVDQAKGLLSRFPDVFELPVDLAFERDGKREEIKVEALPVEISFCDLGAKTIAAYSAVIAQAGTIFANGPAGVYENPLFENGHARHLERRGQRARLFRHRRGRHGQLCHKACGYFQN